jgi:hypothetical protein
MWLTAAECGDSPVVGPGHVVQQCSYTADAGFPSGSSLSLTKPANCPIALAGQMSIPYAATVTLPSNAGSYIQLNSQVDLAVENRSGATTGYAVNNVWSQGNNGLYFVNLNGNYIAASGGFDQYNSGYDKVHNRFRSSQSNNYLSTTAVIAYAFGAPTNYIVSPTDVDAGTSYSVSASTNDPSLVNPLTWSWYVDGTLYGTSSSPEMAIISGAPGTTQEVRAVATDDPDTLVQERHLSTQERRAST